MQKDVHGVRSYYNYIFTHYNYYNMYNCFMLFFLGGLGGGPETSHLQEGGIIYHEGRTFLSLGLDIVSWGETSHLEGGGIQSWNQMSVGTAGQYHQA